LVRAHVDDVDAVDRGVGLQLLDCSSDRAAGDDALAETCLVGDEESSGRGQSVLWIEVLDK